MKKNLIGIIILIALAVVAYFTLTDQNPIGNGSSRELKEFAIKDTASIDKIFISQPNGKQLLLTKNEKGMWLVNEAFPARVDAVDLILKTVYDIKVAGPVSKKSFESVVKRLASGSTKVEYYQGGKKPSKTWYIGDATASRLGTYMLLEIEGEKSSKPYITHRLMERGYLGSRFFLDPLLWKDRLMVRTKPSDIKRVTIKHTVDSMISFELIQLGDATFEITNLESNKTEPLSSNLAIPYLKEFGAVYYEYIDQKTAKTELDSIYNTLPRHKMEIELKDGKIITMNTYYMPVMPGSTLEGKPISFHPERMYSFTSELGPEVHPIVQNLTFDVLVPSFKDFKSSTTVEK